MEFIVTIVFVMIIFMFGAYLFQDRTNFNSAKIVSWNAHQAADQIARGVNTVGLMDNNSLISDYIYWTDPDQSISFSNVSVQANYSHNAYASSKIFFDVNNAVMDYNGLIIFEKKSDAVLIRNG